MNTIEEKARELVYKFAWTGLDLVDCKKCALTCVEELIFATHGYIYDNDYWKEVKDEIGKV